MEAVARRVGLIGEDPTTQRLFDKLRGFARPKLPVLLTGETGVGKEIAARALHSLGLRREAPLVALNCAALPESLAEAELFGHERGAFTGATTSRAGAFEMADQGTLFLDEIGELPLTMQAKLLRVIESGEVRRLGSDRSRIVDIRLLAATNRDLRAEVNRGSFRADLYFRIAVGVIHIAPLRERPRDILPLARHFLEQLEGELGPHTLSEGALERLLRYPWPGNVRELRNVLYLAAVISPGVTIEAESIQLDPTLFPSLMIAGEIKQKPIKDVERELLQAELDRNGWNCREAARSLGMARSTVREKIRRYGLQPKNKSIGSSAE